jgi:hypothetical protein
LYGAELELELLALWEAVNAVVGYIHARGGSREERLLDIPNRIRDAVEFGVHHGAAVALTMAQVQSGHVLHHLVGLSASQELANHDGSREDFNEAVDVVTDLIPAEGIVEEATRGLGT